MIFSQKSLKKCISEHPIRKLLPKSKNEMKFENSREKEKDKEIKRENGIYFKNSAK